MLPALLVAAMLIGISAWLLAANSSLVRASYDWSQSKLIQADFTNEPVAIVYLDLDSFLREKQNPAQPWSRALHAQLLRRLTAAGARAVVFDIIFDAPGEDAKADEEFVEAMRANGHVVLAGEISRGSRSTANTAGFQSLQLTRPDKKFLAAAASWGAANARMDEDFVVRRQFNGFAGFSEPSLAFATAQMLGIARGTRPSPGSATSVTPPVPGSTNGAHLDTAPGSLSPSDGERVGERGFEPTNSVPPLPPLPLSLLLHPMEEREKTGAEHGGVPTKASRTSDIAAPGTGALHAENWLRYYGKPLTIPHVSYSAALRTDEVGDDFYRGKIIFVGARPMTGTILERKDEFRSPLAAWGDRELFMPAVEVHATQLLNLIRGDSLSRLSLSREMILLSLAAVLATLLLFSFRPLPGFVVALSLLFTVLLCVSFALHAKQIWFPWLIISAVQIPGALAGSVLFQSLEWYRQKKKFEAQRRADELKIREQAALIEKAQDAIFVEDLSGNILYANPSAEKLFGGAPDEPEIFSADLATAATVRAAALNDGEWSGELKLQTRAGQKITVTSRCTLIRDETGKPKSLLFINTDVTEKKRLELEAFRAQRLDSIGALAGGIAHDLNNSLAPVLMGLQLLQQQRTDDETRRMLTVMEDNTHRSADMVRQVLLFSRGRENEKEPLSLGNLMREMERIVRQTFPKSINVAALAPADLWPVTGNATQLHQVLLNLCVNARDAMPSGGELTLAADNVELAAAEAAQIPGGRAGKFVMLLVADTGSGIPPEILPRIFEPFFTTKPAGLGTGLGLSTTARIVNQHNGFMNLKSEPGRGTSFEIYLPAATIAPTAPGKIISAAALPQGNGELILMVDDEQSVREMVSLGLTAQGYQVITATNGAEAIALIAQRKHDIRLVLLDDDMPVLTGRAAVPLIRIHSATMPIILMSGKMDSIFHYGQVVSLNKPFQLEELLVTTTQLLSIQGRGVD